MAIIVINLPRRRVFNANAQRACYDILSLSISPLGPYGTKQSRERNLVKRGFDTQCRARVRSGAATVGLIHQVGL